VTDTVPHGAQRVRQVARAFRGPFQRRHGIAARDGIDETLQVGQKRRVGLRQRLAPGTLAPDAAKKLAVGRCLRRIATQFPQPISDGAARDPRRLENRLDPAPPGRQRLRRRKAPPTPFIQHGAQRIVAKLDGGDIDHHTCLQNIAKNGNPKKQMAIQKFIDRALVAGNSGAPKLLLHKVVLVVRTSRRKERTLTVPAQSLRHVCDARVQSGARAGVRHIAAEHMHGARLDLPRPGNQAQHRRLADAVGSDQAHRAAGWQSDLDAGDHLGNAPGNLDQAQADRVELGIAPEGFPGRLVAQGQHQPVGGGVDQQAELVGGGLGARGAIGCQMKLVRLDQVFGLRARSRFSRRAISAGLGDW